MLNIVGNLVISVLLGSSSTEKCIKGLSSCKTEIDLLNYLPLTVLSVQKGELDSKEQQQDEKFIIVIPAYDFEQVLV